jgi:hypothetical protein
MNRKAAVIARRQDPNAGKVWAKIAQILEGAAYRIEKII